MYASATCRAFVALLVGTRISCLRSIHFKCAYAAFNLKIDQSAIVSFWSGYTLAYKNAITMHAALKKTEARLWALQCDPFGNESTETLIPYRWVELPKCRATDKFELYAWSTGTWWYLLALLFVLFVFGPTLLRSCREAGSRVLWLLASSTRSQTNRGRLLISWQKTSEAIVACCYAHKKSLKWSSLCCQANKNIPKWSWLVAMKRKWFDVIVACVACF